MTTRPVAEIADRYRWFAQVEAAGVSPLYEAFAASIAADADVLAFLADLPAGKQQPNLLLAALQYLHGTATSYPELRNWVLEDADRVRTTMLTHATQTNEPARCAALLPLLAGFSEPLTLIEVGASAGLCLYPDRYAYDYGGHLVGGPSPVTLSCELSGPVPVPARVPKVVARMGVDLNPLDPADPDDRAWLHALIWPGHPERRSRLDAALDLAAAEPATMFTGHLLDQLPVAVAAAPAASTTVVFHTAVLAYLSDDDKAAFIALVGGLPVRWISQEGLGVLPAVRDRLPAPAPGDRAQLVLALDGEPVARTAPHGGRLDWLAAT
ncbi:hypothetical protein SAMN05661080_02448 [Modestobacter sp. DSM 44400]|uniref:DUF2332 domain-containing protein n=1 Tax=Modestobacter sp. DSM 44400 TaxID=1550230 RepID=UPI000899D51D|nr:DUF2332 domain-containing protein [Modestobacter sp. DSM 44400]SDY13852.1 hypothetical protein SAMN05661080_02448 [Modestobacter sp. DSM 44400]